VQKGAKRIGTSRWGTEIETVSFKNPDGSVVSVVLNRTNEDLDFAFKIGADVVRCKAEAHSIATYIFE
jgi:glucosylceramidase